MAWRCSGASNSELINNLARAGLLSTPRCAHCLSPHFGSLAELFLAVDRVIEAFRKVDRAYYLSSRGDVYQDSPSYIGFVSYSSVLPLFLPC
jgi:protein-L-isoaspartate(D-aspartate) O-methyltransferase